MTDPTLLYCVGATKAGTSWLYQTLHNHPECHLRAVKEVHYWDTFDGKKLKTQSNMLETRLLAYNAQRDEAEEAGRGWQVRNMDRRIHDLSSMIEMLNADRTWDAGYGNWMLDGVGQHKLVADLTPGYSTLSEDVYRRMVNFKPTARVLYLIRDPLARLWSHIRMQAKRQLAEDQDFNEKANNILWRVIHKGHETHLLERGDYKETISRLRRSVPSGQLMIAYSESMYTPDGIARICDFLGISVPEYDSDTRVHQGDKASMRENLVPQAVRFLKTQYDWVAQNVGPLPAQWQVSLAKG